MASSGTGTDVCSGRKTHFALIDQAKPKHYMQKQIDEMASVQTTNEPIIKRSDTREIIGQIVRRQVRTNEENDEATVPF